MVNQLIDFVDNRVFHKCIKLAISASLVTYGVSKYEIRH